MTSVLHVVECYGAGTATALNQYVRATPEVTHHLLRRLRPEDDHADDGELAAFATVAELPPGVGRAVAATGRHVARLRPDVVHAHSSYAGLFARVARVGRGPRPLTVYTPHCYAFERGDLPLAVRRALRLVERALGRRTDVVAACSRRELDLARRVSPTSRHVLVGNVTDARRTVARSTVAPLAGERRVVATLGRVTGQRDPHVFAAAVARLRTSVDVHAVWIGGGDEDLVAMLRRHDVHVTGWQPHRQALAELEAADAYLHTARWDGAPMSLLEATALEVPAAVLRSPATEGMPAAWVADDADRLADLAQRLVGEPRAREENLRAWRVAMADHTVTTQRTRLLATYGVAP